MYCTNLKILKHSFCFKTPENLSTIDNTRSNHTNALDTPVFMKQGYLFVIK